MPSFLSFAFVALLFPFIAEAKFSLPLDWAEPYTLLNSPKGEEMQVQFEALYLTQFKSLAEINALSETERQSYVQ